MERFELEATLRKEIGKGSCRRLRQKGLLPAVVYSPRIRPVHIALNPLQVKRAMSSGENVLMGLKIQDGGEVQRHIAMVKGYQVHPVKEELLHVDLYEVSLKEAIEVAVPLVLTGEPEGVVQGGTLSPLLRTLDVSCMPEQIPEGLEVDCSSLKIGDTLHVADLKVPPGLQVRTDPSTAVVTVSAPESELAAEAEEPALAGAQEAASEDESED